MANVPYTHGHHDSVLRSHRWRTAENSAGYLLPHLRPGMSLLDVGCGPGTITVDLATRLAPGRVVGLDASAEVLAEARTIAVDGPSGLTFAVGDVFNLDYEDGAFDVVHCHQVLQHLGDPVAALVEMKRVCRPGGLVAARDGDYPAMIAYPPFAELERSLEAYRAATLANGAQCDAGRKLLGWAHRAGFSSVVPSASVWCFATPEDRNWWGDLWADRMTKSSLAEQLLARGIATPEDLDGFAQAWRDWSGEPDGWFSVLHGEVIGTA
ncbi:MAG TPA: methyltransferase domain-containing protein [Acidimicrobiales bacterium]|nr:methyltransferase domain-containing protein [Acidimicrobiales bacterium]